MSFSQYILELLEETKHVSFTTFFEDYVQTWPCCSPLPGRPGAASRQGVMTVPRAIPLHLRAEYRLLQLPAEASLADVRRQYRELAKLYHPDAGGDHIDFLVLQQAHEQAVSTGRYEEEPDAFGGKRRRANRCDHVVMRKWTCKDIG